MPGMWHTVWQEGQWAESAAVVSGQGSDSFDPYDARATVSLGNRVLVTWRTDPGSLVPGVWYAAAMLTAPATAPVALAAPAGARVEISLALEDTPGAAPGSGSVTPFLTPAALPPALAAAENRVPPAGAANRLTWSILPPVALVLVVIIAQAWARPRRVISQAVTEETAPFCSG